MSKTNLWFAKPNSISDKRWRDAWAEVYEKFDKRNAFIKRVINELGYKVDYPSKRNSYKDKTGVVHPSDDSYKEVMHCLPYYIKDGVHYGMDEIHEEYKLNSIPIIISGESMEVISCIE